MRTFLLGFVLAAAARAGSLDAVLSVQPAGDGVSLRLRGVSDVPREVSDLEPLVHVEFSWVDPGSGRAVSLGMRRARLVTDAVEGNPAMIECAPLQVVGAFAGLYRADLVFEPTRQNIRVRALGLASFRSRAEAGFGDAGAFVEQARLARLEVEEDAATVRRLARDLEGLWERSRRAPAQDGGWSEGASRLRDRLATVPPRNRRRPAHAVLEFMPAARGAIDAACTDLAALADGCAAEMGRPPRERNDASLAPAFLRVRAALAALERATRREPAPDLEAARAALATLKRAPAALRGWHDAWLTRAPGHDTTSWTAWRARFESDLLEAALVAGRGAAPERYLDLALAVRRILAELPPGLDQSPSLLSAYASRILGDAGALPDAAVLQDYEREILDRLERVEESMAPKQE